MQLKGCRLVLVGIANSIDLTARVLPRLQSLARKPQLVTFPSYSAPQLEALLHQRLSSLPGPVFHPRAIRLVAKKVSLSGAKLHPFHPPRGDQMSESDCLRQQQHPIQALTEEIARRSHRHIHDNILQVELGAAGAACWIVTLCCTSSPLVNCPTQKSDVLSLSLHLLLITLSPAEKMEKGMPEVRQRPEHFVAHTPCARSQHLLL